MDILQAQNYWESYTREFSGYFSANAIRSGCHPRILLHESPVANSIVLVHGLTDSPYYMTALADHFYRVLNYNVYMPLLQCHGLKDPKGMESASLEEWKSNVRFAIEQASAASSRVSVGGLSTGGTLSYYLANKNANKDSNVNGDLYLFSAALDLADTFLPHTGNLKEALLQNEKAVNLLEPVLTAFSTGKSEITKLAKKVRGIDQDRVVDPAPKLIGENKYRYSAIDLDGARQLAILIAETDEITAGFSSEEPFTTPLFIAHSEADTTADIAGVKNLERVSSNVETFYLPKNVMVSDQINRPVKHAELVLKESNILSDPEQTEYANPEFDNMVSKITQFAQRTTTFT